MSVIAFCILLCFKRWHVCRLPDACYCLELLPRETSGFLTSSFITALEGNQGFQYYIYCWLQSEGLAVLSLSALYLSDNCSHLYVLSRVKLFTARIAELLKLKRKGGRCRFDAICHANVLFKHQHSSISLKLKYSFDALCF